MCMFEVSSKEDHGHQRRGHDFGISHFVLAVLRMVERGQEVGTQAINCQDLVVHGGPPRAGVGG
jgi:hypothetical protein